MNKQFFALAILALFLVAACVGPGQATQSTLRKAVALVKLPDGTPAAFAKVAWSKSGSDVPLKTGMTHSRGRYNLGLNAVDAYILKAWLGELSGKSYCTVTPGQGTFTCIVTLAGKAPVPVAPSMPVPVPTESCGNNICTVPPENSANCPQDCGICQFSGSKIKCNGQTCINMCSPDGTALAKCAFNFDLNSFTFVTEPCSAGTYCKDGMCVSSVQGISIAGIIPYDLPSIQYPSVSSFTFSVKMIETPSGNPASTEKSYVLGTAFYPPGTSTDALLQGNTLPDGIIGNYPGGYNPSTGYYDVQAVTPPNPGTYPILILGSCLPNSACDPNAHAKYVTSITVAQPTIEAILANNECALPSFLGNCNCVQNDAQDKIWREGSWTIPTTDVSNNAFDRTKVKKFVLNVNRGEVWETKVVWNDGTTEPYFDQTYSGMGGNNGCFDSQLIIDLTNYNVNANHYPVSFIFRGAPSGASRWYGFVYITSLVAVS